MYSDENGNFSCSSNTFYNPQRHQDRYQYENKRRPALYSGYLRMSEERYVENNKDEAADPKLKTNRSEGAASVWSQGLEKWTYSKATSLK